MSFIILIVQFFSKITGNESSEFGISFILKLMLLNFFLSIPSTILSFKNKCQTKSKSSNLLIS